VENIDFVSTPFGWTALAVFGIAYGLVICEEFLGLRKSKPVMVAAGIIWVVVAYAYASKGRTEFAGEALRHNLLEYAELLLFLLSAMTYVNTLEERNVFQSLRSRLVLRGFSLGAMYWLTGGLAFFISPLADNLTTALVMGAVALAVGAGKPRFIAVACINIVVAANAGGAFSPFGDVTTLMVWQKGVLRFEEFFRLFVPSLFDWLIPATIMARAVPAGMPHVEEVAVSMKPGGPQVIVLFLSTIALTVALHHFLHLPPFLGMMTGLGALQVYGYFLRKLEIRNWSLPGELGAQALNGRDLYKPAIKPFDIFISMKRKVYGYFLRKLEIRNWSLPGELGAQALNGRDLYKPAIKPFDIFISMKRVEWDTLMFFYGVMLCVGGLGALGYLGLVSEALYSALGPTTANVLIGLLSAVIDNIPIMFAVLGMNPAMGPEQWLLVTLTAGVGGSLLSIGSAAGVALMGQARGVYTFFAHLKWTWAIALGYAASIWVHLLINT
jgi:Na+/H+ antiporter NhaD/arsenite permease-like protein